MPTVLSVGRDYVYWVAKRICDYVGELWASFLLYLRRDHLKRLVRDDVEAQKALAHETEGFLFSHPPRESKWAAL